MASATKTRTTATRLLAAAAVLSGLVLGAAPAHATTTAPATTTATLPVVDMEAVVLAAQIDPRRADNTLTPGAHDSVLAVEQALEARHLLDSRWVDGYFGTTTITAYAAFQRSLGYSGLDANGLPGATSLAALGQGRFTVTHTIGPGAKLQRDGYTIDTRTQNMLTAAEGLLGFHLTLSQGSYNPGGDPTSAGTHDGGGVVDINIDTMSTTTRTDVARALREVGFAAWIRNPTQGNWPWHIHAAAISDTDLSTPAQNQTGDYYLGFNGLANHGADDGPRIPIQTWEQYQRTH
ncbi:peptidoglycan-binding protein [Kitasatospora sp. NPDC058965]|uniref:peptidoglycan-binding protein n=1 Tax=Kitasatospora sp. NPDC058965 TaxID=3346682 RepID=UPI0036C053F1